VGECFFWYRLTRVVPDKFHRAVKWLCVYITSCFRDFANAVSVTHNIATVIFVTLLCTSYVRVHLCCGLSFLCPSPPSVIF